MLDRLPFGSSEGDARKAWDEALLHTESKLKADWVTCGLVPLQRTVRGYTLKKTLAIRSVSRSCALSLPVSSGGGGDNSFREEDLQSIDGLLKGRADLIERRNGEWVLVDYKSGAIHEDDETSGQQRIKDEYAVQLRLYAYLIREVRGIVIARALLRTLDGREHEVEVNAANVDKAGEEARELLREFNKEIQARVDPLEMAKPMAASWDRGVFGCVGCLYRPSCPAYRSCDKRVASGERWPRDVWGRVTSIEQVGGILRIGIRSENQLFGAEGDATEPSVLLDLKDSIDRHPWMKGLQVGSQIQVYDYIVSRFGVAGSDGPRTCVYASAILSGDAD
jgi:hypothetical protein